MEPQHPASILKASDYGHQNRTPPGDEPPPNLPPRKASRLQLPALKIPSRPSVAPPTAGTATTAGTVTWGPAHHAHHAHHYLGQPAYYPAMPMTPTTGIMGGATGVPIGMAGALGRFNVYPTKASEFMFKQFEGFKDFTMNTAKIGLSHGEKTAFWLHGKVSSWSRRWFTHIFLFLVVFAYSLLGAMLFVAIEGRNEDAYRDKILEEQESHLKTMYRMAKDTALVEDEGKWMTRAHQELEKYKLEQLAHFKNGETNNKDKVWTLWNAVFYCGTIYTTIDGAPARQQRRHRPARRPGASRTATKPHNGPCAAPASHSGARQGPRAPRSEGHGRQDEDAATTTTEDSEDGRGVGAGAAPGPRAKSSAKRSLDRSKQAGAAPRSKSQGCDERPTSTSEDDDDYWHKYFAIQKNNIDKHNGSSLAAAAAGVLRPGPVREKSRKGDSTISRKSTAEKADRLADRLSERRPSAPNFSTVQDGEPLPPTPKPTLRRRAARSKSRGPPEEPAPAPAPALAPAPGHTPAQSPAESASETSSTTSKTSKADKSVIWKKWSQAPEPNRKEVLSIDPAEVLRGLVPDEDLPPQSEDLPAPAVPEQRKDSLQPDSSGEGWFSWSRKSSERSSRSNADRKQDNGGEQLKAEEGERTAVSRKSSLRRERPRKDSKPTVVDEKVPEAAAGVVAEPPAEKKPSWLARLLGRKPAAPPPAAKPKAAKVNWVAVARDLKLEWHAFRVSHPAECNRLRLMGNRCCTALLLMLLYCGLGGLVFRFIEGSFESFYKCGVKRVKRDFLDTLWTTSHNLREDEWKMRARRRLWEFEEELHAAHEAGVTSYSGIKSWTFLNAVVYCLTVVTTIGYGHISPSTTTGRAVTIVYAIIGIPMFLILLADFGKLFTRGIKFVWSFVRRLYYTGSCRQVRRTQPVQSAIGFIYSEIMKGAQIMYDLATFRRPSMFPQGEPPADVDVEGADTPLRHEPATFRRDAPDSSEPPATPAPSAFEVDDEFNLPISVAIVILLLYMFVGASVYTFWESWGFFESFYFVFISMSTIGFGDFVPKHPMYMMASIVYLVFGLALTSMCINVVQEKLSDSFRQASAKIGATIGLRIAEQEGEDGSTNPPTPGNGQVQDDEQGEQGVQGSPYSMHNGAREVPS